MIMKKKGGMRIKFGKTIHRKTGLTRIDSGTMNRKEASGRPRSVTTEENTDSIEELLCSQEKAPHTHLAPRKLPNNLESVVRQIEE